MDFFSFRQIRNRAKSRAFILLLGTVYQELRFVLPQFFNIKYPVTSVLRILHLSFSSFMRLVLGRSVKFSYAFTGEDRIIDGLLNRRIQYCGYYVEVGANHPVFLSNTFGLYRRGWKGICIDANEKLIRKYSLFRPKDIAECALVSDDHNPKKFYFIENDVLSSAEESNAIEAVAKGLSVKEKMLNTKSLTEILDKYNAPILFDLLSIDAEEHDVNVLKSLDLKKYQPKLIILELENFNLKSVSENDVVTHLQRFDYKLAGYVLKNAYFVKNK
ncbi:MAG: FkbM family methyltransferase [Cyclobacteriaceae bacterium]|nr:FkbM family methyltransferase [Cyclobacteriaceae bacterium]